MRKEFAKNSVPLPVNPDEYKEGICYTSDLDKTKIEKGLTSKEIIETSMLNTYFKNILDFLNELSNFGICKKSDHLSQGVDYTDNSLTMSDDLKIKIGNNFLHAEATETKNGLIKISEIYNDAQPIDRVALSSNEQPGKIQRNDFIEAKDIYKTNFTDFINNNAITTSPDSKYYYNGNDVITLNINSNNFPFKKFLINKDKMNVTINGEPFTATEIENDFFVYNTGEVFG